VTVVLQARQVRYYSAHDEALFFEWLDRTACISKYEGIGDTVHIHVDETQVGESELRELLAIFFRYRVDMTQLRVFDSAASAAWFRNEAAYWHSSVFGS